MSDRQGPFAKDSQTFQFPKNHSPKIRRVSSPKTIRQRFANVSARRKPFAKDSLTSQFAKNHSTKIRQCDSSPKAIRKNDSPKDSQTCQFARNDSPKSRQRVRSPRTIRQTFANVSVRQGAFAKYSKTSQFSKDHSPKHSSTFQFAKDHSPKDSLTCQIAKDHSPKIRRVSSPKTFRQRFPYVSVRQKPFDKDSPM